MVLKLALAKSKVGNNQILKHHMQDDFRHYSSYVMLIYWICMRVSRLLWLINAFLIQVFKSETSCHPNLQSDEFACHGLKCHGLGLWSILLVNFWSTFVSNPTKIFWLHIKLYSFSILGRMVESWNGKASLFFTNVQKSFCVNNDWTFLQLRPAVYLQFMHV